MHGYTAVIRPLANKLGVVTVSEREPLARYHGTPPAFRLIGPDYRSDVFLPIELEPTLSGYTSGRAALSPCMQAERRSAR